MMIQLRNDNLISRSHLPPKSPGELVGEGGHVGAEDDLVRGGTQEVRHGLTGLVPDSVRLSAGGEGPMGVGIPVEEVIRHGDGYGVRDLGSTGAIEEGGGVTTMKSPEGGEVGPDFVHAGQGHDHLETKGILGYARCDLSPAALFLAPGG